MINKSDDYVGWAGLAYDLQDAHEHLGRLMEDMTNNPEFGEIEYSIQMAHIYAHLNRAWNARNLEAGYTPKQMEKLSQFPKDIKPL